MAQNRRGGCALHERSARIYVCDKDKRSIGRKRMSETVHPVPQDFARHAFINHAKYLEMYRQSVVDPDGFWREQARRIDWITPFKRVKNTSFKLPNVSIKWFEDGELNVS